MATGGKPRIGIALGSGAARGWAHIGVLRALAERGIVPDVVAGSSMGAAVGGAFASDSLDALETWARSLEWRTVLGFFDLTFRGGLIGARRLIDTFAGSVPDQPIEKLPKPLGVVATDLATGREVWIREGSLLDAIRASVALPALVAPSLVGDQWLVDGGLVNPVPVSLCRALGADVVIAVDLNTMLLGRRLRGPRTKGPAEPRGPVEEAMTARFRTAVRDFAFDLRQRFLRDDEADGDAPTIFDVMANTINIMQVRITRSRMAGDPPDLLITPRLAGFGLLDFDHAAEAIDEGRAAVARALASGPPDFLVSDPEGS